MKTLLTNNPFGVSSIMLLICSFNDAALHVLNLQDLLQTKSMNPEHEADVNLSVSKWQEGPRETE